jgi:predicted site-specific integrase-resolvase
MITPDQAATVAGVSLRTVFHWVEAGRVHSAKSTSEHLSICLASLPVRWVSGG